MLESNTIAHLGLDNSVNFIKLTTDGCIYFNECNFLKIKGFLQKTAVDGKAMSAASIGATYEGIFSKMYGKSIGEIL